MGLDKEHHLINVFNRIDDRPESQTFTEIDSRIFRDDFKFRLRPLQGSVPIQKVRELIPAR